MTPKASYWVQKSLPLGPVQINSLHTIPPYCLEIYFDTTLTSLP